ncbi:hypothetical protein OWV82_006054 [Melia azedarach]|uniref:Uncharacterized protein n=1 Tax=Melia azedarach TaxID=155640 RepID=A0ACC1YHU2_MELAZ|nr:hypothetical protein OWV82_006054 [Melia azedarach]
MNIEGNSNSLNAVQEGDFGGSGVNIEGENYSGLNDFKEGNNDGLGVSVDRENSSGGNDAEEGDYNGFGDGLGATLHTECNNLDYELNEPNVEDFEVLEDIELHLCDSDDKDEGRYDSKDEEPPTNMHRNLMVKEFKYQPNRFIKLAV